MPIERTIKILALTALIALAGCIFETRDAEPPPEGGEVSWLPPTVPGRVFLNMQSGLEDLTGVNYTRSIANDFTFEPLPADAADPSLIGKFDNWTRDVELQVTDRLVAESSSLEVTFTFTQIRDQNPFADYEVDYILHRITNTVPPDTIDYRGRAQFDMRNGSSGWELIKWRDIESVAGFLTWGYLRGTLRQ